MEEHRQERIKDNLRRLERAEDYDEIFEIVKYSVERSTGLHRAGLSLILTDMPNLIGAYYPVFSNTIVVNRGLIEDLRSIVRDPREINAFIYTVLLHEYLHSLGYLEDQEVRRLARKIASMNFGEDHITVKFSDTDWLKVYPELANRRRSFSKLFRPVERFDSSSSPYFG